MERKKENKDEKLFDFLTKGLKESIEGVNALFQLVGGCISVIGEMDTELLKFYKKVINAELNKRKQK